jgi:GGDEF domain-containing protein
MQHHGPPVIDLSWRDQRLPMITLQEAEEDTAPVAAGGGFANMVAALQALAPRADSKKPAPPAPDAPEDESIEQALDRMERLMRDGQVHEGLDLCHRMWPVVSRTNDPAQMGRCQAAMMMGYNHNGLYTAAFATGRRAIELLGRAGNSGRLLSTLTIQAVSLASLGHKVEALDALSRAAALLPSVPDDTLAQCSFWHNAGAVYMKLERADLAMECATRCLRFASHLDDPSIERLAASRLFVARVQTLHDRRASWDDMQEAYLELRHHLEQEIVKGNLSYAVVSLVVLAVNALTRLQRWDEGRALLRIGLSATAGPEVAQRRARIELSFAQLERHAGQHRIASAYAKQALALLETQQDPLLLADVHLENSLLHEAQGHWRLALESHREYTRLREEWVATHERARTEASIDRAAFEGTRACEQVEALRGMSGEAPAAASDLACQALPGRHALERHVDRARVGLGRSAPPVLMIGRLDHAPATGAAANDADGFDWQRAVCAHLQQHLGPGDMVARWSEDEIVVGFGQGLPLEACIGVATRLCETIARQGGPCPCTISFGLTAMGETETLGDAVLRAAWVLQEARDEGPSQVRAM